MEKLLDILFAPVRWVWGAISWLQEGPGSTPSWDPSSPGAFIVLAVCTLFFLVFIYAMFAFTAHWALTSIAWHWSELLRERAERGTIDDMLDLAVQAQRSKSRLYSLASRTGVRYNYAGNYGPRRPELAGADKLPRRRTLGRLTTAVIAVERLALFLFRLLRATLSSTFGIYVLLGTTWTLRPHWFTASVDTFRGWARTWDPATVPAAIGLVATVLGLIAAYAFSTKRRARHKSMFDAAVAAENTLAVLGPRAGTAAIQVAKLAHTVARHERILYENAVADLSDGRLRLQDGKVTMVNHGRADGSYQSWQHPEWRAWRTKANKDEWMKLCEQRETTLATLTSLREALSQVESLSPFVRQAGTHSWALLLDSSPQSPRTSPWLAVTLYNEERYKQQREDLRYWIDCALEDGKSPTAGDGNTADDIRQFNLEQIQTRVEKLQWNSRRSLWYLSGLYAKLVLCDEEVHGSRRLRGIKAFVARFIKT